MIVQLKGNFLTKGFLVSLIAIHLHPLIFAQDEVGSKNIDNSYFFDLDKTESQIAHYKKHAGSVLVNPIFLDSDSDDNGYDNRGEKKRFVAFNLDPMFPPYNDVIDRLQVPIEQKVVNSDTVENISNQPNKDNDHLDLVDSTERSSIKYDADEEIGTVDSSTEKTIYGGSDDMGNGEEMKGKSNEDEECNSNCNEEGGISNDSIEHEVVSIDSVKMVEATNEGNGLAEPQNETIATEEILNMQHETESVNEHTSITIDGEKTPSSSQNDDQMTNEKHALPADEIFNTTQDVAKDEQEKDPKEETNLMVKADETDSLQYKERDEVDDTTLNAEQSDETRDTGKVSSDDQLDGLEINVQPDGNNSEGSVIIEANSKNLTESDESNVTYDEVQNDSTDETYATADSEVSEDTENAQAKYKLDLNDTTSVETMKISGESESPEDAMEDKIIDDRDVVDEENYGSTNDTVHEDEKLDEVLETTQTSPELSNVTKAINENVDDKVDEMISMQDEEYMIEEKYQEESDSKLEVSGEHMKQDEIEVSSDIPIEDDESITVPSIQTTKANEDELPQSNFYDENEVETDDLSQIHVQVQEVDPIPTTLEFEESDIEEDSKVILMKDDVEESNRSELEDDVEELKHNESEDDEIESKLIESEDDVERSNLIESEDDVEESNLIESEDNVEGSKVVEDDIDKSKLSVLEDDIEKSKLTEVEDYIDESQSIDNGDRISKEELNEREESKSIEAEVEDDTHESQSTEIQDESSSSANTDFVVGLDDIHKFFEDVDPPDELDPGAGGLSLEEVLKAQGIQIIKTRMNKSIQSIKKGVNKVRTKFDEHFGDNEGVQAFGRWCANTKEKILQVKEDCVENVRELLERFRGSDDFEPLYDEDPEDEKILEMRRKLMEQ